MWFVYILLCQDKSLYTGITNNLKNRLKAHLEGRGGSYTRSHQPLKILYTENCQTKSDALKRELEIKSWNRAKKIKMLNLQIIFSKLDHP